MCPCAYVPCAFMKFKSISSRAVLITGGSQRIGQAIALALAGRGFDIALHYNHSKKEALALAAQILRKGVRCELFACDLTKEFQVLLLLEKVYKKFPQLNLLINNASIFLPSEIGHRGLKLLDEHWSVNFKAPFILSGEFARLCRSGQIINILDTKVVKNKTAHAGYLVSKKALHELTKMAAVEWAPRIRVNAVAPGIILPPSGKGKDYLAKRAKQIPLQKQGDVRYITQSIEFLIDNEFVTGQVIFADGGEHLI